METPPFGISLAAEREAAFNALKESIAQRLAPLCSAWAKEEFENLVDHIARTTLKYEPRLLAIAEPPKEPGSNR